jgi:DNA-directed RNA polymerase subunit RPC12/RpoP
MALVKCVECTAQVSTQAKRCPQCGAKVKKPAGPVAKTIAALFAILIVSSIILSQQQQAERDEAKRAKEASITPQQREAEEKHKARVALAAAGAQKLKHAMKDPLAFQLTSLVVKDDGVACYDYRAKNSFGAVLPSSAVLTKEGNIYTQEQNEDIFAYTWNASCTKPGGEDITERVNALILQ